MTRMGSIQRGSLESVCRLGVKPRGDTRDRARNPRVFGSVLHGDDAEGSDLDLLIDPTTSITTRPPNASTIRPINSQFGSTLQSLSLTQLISITTNSYCIVRI